MLSEKSLKGMLSSNKQDWTTPLYFFNKLNSQFHFTLDSASDDSNHLCEKYYTFEDNGLLHNWSNEVVWCNPPYCDNSTWVKKCYYENFLNDVFIVLLVPVRTDSAWFHDYIYNNPNCQIIFLRGRLKFGGSKTPAPFPSMVVIFRNKQNLNKIYEI